VLAISHDEPGDSAGRPMPVTYAEEQSWPP
jgi:hypothetical protein